MFIHIFIFHLSAASSTISSVHQYKSTSNINITGPLGSMQTTFQAGETSTQNQYLRLSINFTQIFRGVTE